VLEGGNSVDILTGGTGNDTLVGGNSSDMLMGGNGDDTLIGGNSADVLAGGAGNDSLDGGNGRDSYVFADAGTDTIVDYERGESIDLSALVDVSADDVTISAGSIFVDLEGSDDLTILVGGDSVRMQDILFAPADLATTSMIDTHGQYMIA
jgi:Ca2+-binding RTX toxin-like protein